MTDLNQRIDELARTLADQAIDAHNRLAYPRATIETLFASAMRKLVEEVEHSLAVIPVATIEDGAGQGTIKGWNGDCQPMPAPQEVKP